MTADRIDRIVNQGMPQRPVPVGPGRPVGPQAPVAGSTGTAFQDVLTEELSRSPKSDSRLMHAPGSLPAG